MVLAKILFPENYSHRSVERYFNPRLHTIIPTIVPEQFTIHGRKLTMDRRGMIYIAGYWGNRKAPDARILVRMAVDGHDL